MKNIIFLTVIILGSLSCSVNNEKIVKSYISEINNHDFRKASFFLDSTYTESFIDGSIEVKNINHLKDLIEWRKVMESKSKILSIESSGNTVTTKEEFNNIMDEILERKPRTFKITYTISESKILKSTIDTIPGYSNFSNFNSKKIETFNKYCEKEGLEYGTEMTVNGATLLKKSLKKYANSQE